MMLLMVGDAAINGDVVGDDDDDGGRAPCTGTRVVSGRVFCQISPKFAKIYIFQPWISPCLDTVLD